MLNFYGTANPNYPNPAAPEPSGLDFQELTPEKLRANRTSVKYRRYPADVLPMFIAEMDFPADPLVREAIIARVQAGDMGYMQEQLPVGEAFAAFAADEWGWQPNPNWVRTTADLAIAIVEIMRVLGPYTEANIAVCTPAYNGFYEMFSEIPGSTLLEIPFTTDSTPPSVTGPSVSPRITIDFEALEAAFAGTYHDTRQGANTLGKKATVFILANPQNPHGTVWRPDELERVAQLAAQYGVPILADEVHAPMTHAGRTFTPFAPIALKHGAKAFVLSSASKTWNVVGTKCALMIATCPKTAAYLDKLPPEVVSHTSVLGAAANIAAFTHGNPWRARLLERIAANANLFHELLTQEAPGVKATVPDASYISWVDLRNTAIGDDPWQYLFDEGRVAFANGLIFGRGGRGFVRFNLGCAPDTVREGVNRLAKVLQAHNN